MSLNLCKLIDFFCVLFMQANTIDKIQLIDTLFTCAKIICLTLSLINFIDVGSKNYFQISNIFIQ